jgi:ketosteroid isomerase-like protein
VPQPAKIGDLTFTAAEDGDSLVLELANPTKRVVRRAKVESYGEGSGDTACSFRPTFNRLFFDQAKRSLYVAVGFRWRDDCGPQLERYLVWDMPTPEEDELAKLVTAQFEANADVEKLFAKDAQLVNGSDLATDAIPYIIKAGNETYTGHDDANLQLSRSRDGQTAWASLTTKLSILPQNERGRDDPWRASSVLARTPAGWRIVATTWTAPRANAAVNKDAKAGRLPSLAAFTADPGDASLRAAFAKLATDGLDGDAANRADLVAIGSGPGERTTTGATFAKGWNAGWKGKTTITSSIARLAPSGTTGWVAANVELSKGSYKIPFHVFAVFDKTQAGAWSLVHVHFSI